MGWPIPPRLGGQSALCTDHGTWVHDAGTTEVPKPRLPKPTSTRRSADRNWLNTGPNAAAVSTPNVHRPQFDPARDLPAITAVDRPLHAGPGTDVSVRPAERGSWGI